MSKISSCILAACMVVLVCLPASAAQTNLVKMETSMGDMAIELYPDKAPRTVANFLRYAREGAYDGTIFHRVIRDFMIQGGGFTPAMHQKPTAAPIRNEADNGLKNEPYTIAMARTNEPHSATNQFFINTVNNKGLNYTSSSANGWGYCVFGKVIDGIDVVNKIRAVPTGRVGMHDDVPKVPVIIKRVTVVR